MSAIFDLIRKPFGWLIQWFYSLTGNYLIAILVFSVVLKLVLFPFGIKQQKNSQKQAALRPKENVIRKKYAGRSDRATQLKMNTEIQELYQKENYSPLAGCLPMLLQMLVLIAVYEVIRMPLTYTANMPKPTVENIQVAAVEMVYEEDKVNFEKQYDEYLDNKAQGDFRFTPAVSKYVKVSFKTDAKPGSENFKETYLKAFETAFKATLAEEKKYQFNSEVLVINYIKAHRDEFSESYDKLIAGKTEENILSSEEVMKKLPNLVVFKGFDLGLNPSFDSLKEKELGRKLILLVPVLSLVTAYFGQALTRKFTYQPEQTEEMKSQMRIMNIFLPLFSFYIAFQVPAAVGIYWVMSNVLSPVQQIALSKMFPIKEITPEEMREAERLYGGKQKKKKGNTATVDKDGNAVPAKKKKSLVYDDDDEYESVTTVNEKDKKVLKEKEESGDKNLVEKAPLKDE